MSIEADNIFKQIKFKSSSRTKNHAGNSLRLQLEISKT